MMPFQLHNTLTGKAEPFRPLKRGKVLFYSCGPTVYDFAHIGNFRSFLNADVLRRWLESPLCQRVDPDGNPEGDPGEGGYNVTHVMNITDVGHMVDDAALDGGGEDKMEAASQRLIQQKQSGKLPDGASDSFDPSNPYDIADFYAQAFIEDAKLLGIKVALEADDDPTLLPRPTRMIKPMLEMIMTLIDNGNAYIASDGVCYFNTKSFPAYGRLSGNTMDKIRSGAGGRVSESAQQVKQHPADFMLWKPDPTHMMRWDPSTELGRDIPLKEGYPGWHLECSVMANQRLAKVIDIHSGGEDNIFPHHECEIAQSCCANGEEFFARFWYHTRFLIVEGAKMSKSKGNFFTVRDLTRKGFDPAAIRLELIKTNYRQNANFTEQGLKDSGRRIERWRRLAKIFIHLRDQSGFLEPEVTLDSFLQEFTVALNDDLSVGRAIAVIDKLVSGLGIGSFETDDGEERGKIAQSVFDTVTLPDRPLGLREAWTLYEESVRRHSSSSVLAVLHLFDNILGVIFRPVWTPPAQAGDDEDTHIDDLVRRRQEARQSKDWSEADKIRDELNELNVEVTDSPEGPSWARKVGL